MEKVGVISNNFADFKLFKKRYEVQGEEYVFIKRVSDIPVEKLKKVHVVPTASRMGSKRYLKLIEEIKKIA